MRHTAVIVIVVTAAALQLSAVMTAQVPGAAAQPQTVIGGNLLSPTQATISGNVVTPGGQPLTNITAQARNLLTAQVGGSVPAAATGQYSIVGLNPGYYVVEVVDATGQIIGTSGFIVAPAGAVVTAATVMATSGALTAVSAATGLAATLGATAARSVSFAAAAAGVAGVVAPLETPVASPSR